MRTEPSARPGIGEPTPRSGPARMRGVRHQPVPSGGGAPAAPVALPGAQHVARLTRREREVLELMAQGHGNAAICDLLFVSAKTLERHVQQIFVKLELPPDDARHRRVCAVLAWLGSPLAARRAHGARAEPPAIGRPAGLVPGPRPSAGGSAPAGPARRGSGRGRRRAPRP